MNQITILITTFELTQSDIVEKLAKMNLQAPFIVRNQNALEDSISQIVINGFAGKIINVQNERGASKNRNELIRIAESKYFILADDDISFKDGSLISLLEFIEQQRCDAVKYLVELPAIIGRNAPKNKPMNKKRLIYSDCTDVGPWAYCFSKDFVRNNNIFFLEDIGPGTEIIKAGEDVLFIKQAFRKGINIVPFNQTIASVAQTESTWFTGFNKNQLITEGGIYYLLYKPFHLFFYARHYMRFRKQYNLSFFCCLNYMKEGKEYAKSLLEKK